MKSTIIGIEKPTTITYPCIMEYTMNHVKINGTLVLFTSETEGTVVHAIPGSCFELGLHSKSWTPCSNHLRWKPFHGTLTINTEED